MRFGPGDLLSTKFGALNIETLSLVGICVLPRLPGGRGFDVFYAVRHKRHSS